MLVQWLSKAFFGSEGSINRIVPTPFSMHAVYTPPLPGIAAYAMPATANAATADPAAKSSRLPCHQDLLTAPTLPQQISEHPTPQIVDTQTPAD